MKKYNFEEFKAILKSVLYSHETKRTFSENIDSYLTGEDSFFFALNGSNDEDERIKDCENVLFMILDVELTLSTYEDIRELFDRYEILTINKL